MGVSQISVFLENQPGHLRRVLAAFETNGLDIRGFCAGDTGDYGIVRFITDDPEKALSVLKNMDAAAKMTEVVCLKLDDTPGELARVMEVLADADINIIYAYSLISTYVALYTSDTAATEKTLGAHSFELVHQEDLV